ncbi:MAG: NAD(P)/FAD-dependent oxidoreductase [Candidatus Omnitrophota bacterium]
MVIKTTYDTIIIGAGPAGLMAAIQAYKPSSNILVLERMPKPALKLRISGKGRCNITNSAELDDFISHFGKNGRFLKYAFSEFFSDDLLDFFKKLGVGFKLERGGRYFPKTDNADSIVNALLNKTKALNIPIFCNCEVTDIEKLSEGGFVIKITKDKREDIDIEAKSVVLACGGKSYPATGSNGTGFKLASNLGHKTVPISPALVPIVTKGNIAKNIQGLSLKNVKAKVLCEDKKVDERFGEMVFTDFGLSGPIILSLSKAVLNLIKTGKKAAVSIDLKPALSSEVLDKRLLKEINNYGGKTFKSLLKMLLPSKLIPVFIELCNVPGDKRLNQMSAQERKKLRMLLQDFRFEVKGVKSFNHAIVTSGGVNTKEINSKTMESKLLKGLYFAGEVIDIDADTGGFNIQAAFSTGWVAGQAVKDSV